MTTNSTPHESKMLEEVRRWRREAFEADQARTPGQRAVRIAELLQRFGLSLRHKEAPPKTTNGVADDR